MQFLLIIGIIIIIGLFIFRPRAVFTGIVVAAIAEEVFLFPLLGPFGILLSILLFIGVVIANL